MRHDIGHTRAGPGIFKPRRDCRLREVLGVISEYGVKFSVHQDYAKRLYHGLSAEVSELFHICIFSHRGIFGRNVLIAPLLLQVGMKAHSHLLTITEFSRQLSREANLRLRPNHPSQKEITAAL
jgi:hypothetical protein